MTEANQNAPPPHSRLKAIVAASLILFPVFLTIVEKFWSADEEAAGISGISSVVVVPAKVFGVPEPSYLSDAVAGTLTAYLTGVPGLETRLPPSSIDFASIGNDYNKLADAYGVKVLVLTAITTDAGLYMVNVQVIDPRSQTVLWTNRYQSPHDKYLGLIQAAGEALRRAIRPESSRLDFKGGVSSNSQAELAFREGEYYRDRHDFDPALTAFRRSLDIDPTLAKAAAEIAMLYAVKVSKNLSEVEAWTRRALEIDPRCGRAYVALAEAEQSQPKPDPERRLANAIRGVALDPLYPIAHKVLGVALSGSPDLSRAADNEWRRLAPLDQDKSSPDELKPDSDAVSRILEEARARGELPAYLNPRLREQ